VNIYKGAFQPMSRILQSPAILHIRPFLWTILFIVFSTAVSAQNIAAGEYYSLVLCTDGTVRTFGSNVSGQLGDSTVDNKNVAVLVKGLSGVIAIAGEGNRSIALKNDSTVWGWGLNYNGQIGDSSNFNRSVPVRVYGVSEVIAIAAGTYHSMALKKDGTVWMWGSDQFGQLGNGIGSSWTPVQVNGLSGVTAIAATGYSSFALKNDNTLWAWGYNLAGELGIGNNSPSNLPVQVSGLSNITAVTGTFANVYAIKNDGTVWAWGSNTYHQLGNNIDFSSNIPRQVIGISGVKTITGGFQHSLALKNDGTVWAWGNNSAGQLGNGAIDSNSIYVHTPTKVLELSGVREITGGGTHSLAIKNDGTVWAWGYNLYGQLGNGTNTEFYTTPVIVTGTWQAMTSVAEQRSLPVGFVLSQNYPNPFNPSTTLQYSIPVRSTVRLSIYTILGQKISEIVNETKDAGSYEQTFNASQLSSGIYFYRIDATSTQNAGKTFVETKKMVLMR
jgi:alpha-tubulin suppressor-like RCC1 family protein